MPDSEAAQCAAYVVTRFASQANRRIVQLASLRESLPGLVLVRQSRGGTFASPYDLCVRQYPNVAGLLRRIGLPGAARWIETRCYFPSGANLYVRPATRTLARQIRRDRKAHKQVCLITCVPPHDLVLVGLSLKRRFPEIFWIIDWGDLWSYDDYYFATLPQRWRARARRMERYALRTCDTNVVSNHHAREVLERVYSVPEDRVVAISHAYDERDLARADVEQVRLGESAGPVTIGFLGNLFKPPKVPGHEIIHALERARQGGIDLVLHIVGDKYLSKVTTEPVRELDWVVVHGLMEHHKSLREVARCDFLLLALADLPNSRIIMHTKLPYYLMLGRPILAIVPETSATAAIIRETGAGYVIPADGDWASDLVRVLQAYKREEIRPRRNEKAIAQFSWRRVSQQWLELIDAARVTCGRGP